ncbi:hypothetical protein E3E11_04460 [Oecophyllibacter saccharovorans]|uniref:hypothetical protein n=1 Tax=Oecophyllibacter saccharovorans TaxID=2558360 RepID=UPI00114324A1|nr:hypothetical protein [Oecophyllibacter saccharovorans]QDH15227.1 hypothetical protein E3E11_04460 [Oecophyllibacter saccharovorans]
MSEDTESRTGQDTLNPQAHSFPDLTPGLRELVENWVVKTTPDHPPHRLTAEELAALARASVETMAARALGFEEQPESSSEAPENEPEAAADERDGLAPPWGALERLTSDWLVQRERGTRPTPLSTADYRSFVRLVLKGLSCRPDARQRAEMAESLTQWIPESLATLPDGRQVEEVLKEDPLYFARQHLRASL